jgi:alcohol dehydrogenase (cytochrome c)
MSNPRPARRRRPTIRSRIRRRIARQCIIYGVAAGLLLVAAGAVPDGFHLSAAAADAKLPVADQSWPTYGYTYANTRHVDFDDITSRSVHRLAPAWEFPTGVYGAFETTPIVVGRTMYLTTGSDHAVIALDAKTGALRWRVAETVAATRPCCGLVNRGVAVADNRVFVATLDNRLLALDAATGRQVWETRIADPGRGYTETMAPLAWRGLVFVGSAGGERDIPRGFVDAYDARTGRRVWRWWSMRRPHEPGGGAVWMTPALDPVRSALYVGVGNPNYRPRPRRGEHDDLYSCSITALDARTGKLLWSYQEVPRDVWDYDAASPPVLLRVRDRSGRMISAVGEAGKTGWFYLVRRSDGRLIRRSQAFVAQRNVFAPLSETGSVIAPSGYGGAVAPVAYDRRLRLVFIQAKEGSFRNVPDRGVWMPVGSPAETLSAVDVDTGRIAWRRVIPGVATPNRVEGPLSAADVVFLGQESGGALYAFSARNGALLWHWEPSVNDMTGVPRRTFRQWLHDVVAGIQHALLGSVSPSPTWHIQASPIAYVVGGREYIAVAVGQYYRVGRAAGDTVFTFALP